MMLLLLLFILSVIAILFVDYIWEIHRLYCQLRDYNEGRSRTQLSNRGIFRGTERLAFEINRTLDEEKKLRIDAEQHENKLRESIGGLGHDLRTPLTVLQGYAEFLMGANLPDSQQVYLTSILRKSTQLTEIIDSFQDVYMLENYDTVLRIEKFDLTDLLVECILDHSNLFVKENICPQIMIPEKSYYIKSDKLSCRRIIDNLLTNARRYTTGEIKIELSEQSDDTVSVSIANKAENLNDKDITRIYDRFFQIDRSRGGKGQGIGLYIVKLLVNKLGIGIETELKDKWLIITLHFCCINPE